LLQDKEDGSDQRPEAVELLVNLGLLDGKVEAQMSGLKKASCTKLGLLEGDEEGDVQGQELGPKLGDEEGEVQGQELGPELGAAETRGDRQRASWKVIREEIF
jgi:hypothetical protein